MLSGGIHSSFTTEHKGGTTQYLAGNHPHIVVCYYYLGWDVSFSYADGKDTRSIGYADATGRGLFAMYHTILSVRDVEYDRTVHHSSGRIATSLSVIVGGVMALSYLLFFADTLRLVSLKLSRKSLILAFRNIGYQCKIGSSSLFGELTLAVLIFVGNLVFMKYLGDAGVGAFGIACYYAPFFFMMGNAVAQSAQPIISYNYGISRWKEIKEARKLLLFTSIAIGSVVALLFIFIPEKLVALFVDTASEAGKIAIEGFPYFATGIVFFILNVAIVGYYQSVEQIKRATVFVFLRGFALLVPSFILLPELLGTEGIWLAMPLAELMTAMIIVMMYFLNTSIWQPLKNR